MHKASLQKEKLYSQKLFLQTIISFIQYYFIDFKYKQLRLI